MRDEVHRPGLHGLKCYHFYAPQKPTWQADIPAYLARAFQPAHGLKGLPQLADLRTLYFASGANYASRCGSVMPVCPHWHRDPTQAVLLAPAAKGEKGAGGALLRDSPGTVSVMNSCAHSARSRSSEGFR